MATSAGGFLSERGWRGRLVPLPRRAKGPLFLQLRSGGPLTHFSARGERHTPEVSTPEVGGLGVMSTWGRQPFPFVLPPAATHVAVERHGGDSGGFARWYLRSVPRSEVRELVDGSQGEGNEIFAWQGGPRRISFELSGNENWAGVNFINSDGSWVNSDVEGHMRGHLRIPGPGYVQVRCLKSWKLALV